MLCVATRTRKTVGASKLLLPALCAGILFFPGSPARASGTGSALSEDWQFSVTPYAWVPEIKGELPTGSEFDIGMGDLIDNLNMFGLGRFEARRSKWSFALDGVYLNLGFDGGGRFAFTPASGIPVGVEADLKLRTWVWTLIGGYNVWHSTQGTLDVIAGARYLEISVALDASKRLGPFTRETEETGLGTSVDALLGVRGDISLNDRWFAPYYLDVGTGDSDLTWQVAAGVGYRFDWGNVSLLYRHLDYDFSSGSTLDSLEASGPMLSATFHF